MAFQLLINGLDIAGTTPGGRVVLQEWPGILAKTVAVSLPSLSASTWPDIFGIVVPRQFSVGLALIGTNAAAFNTLFDTVAAAVQVTAPVTLTRVRDLVGSTETKTCKAIYLGGMEPTMASDAVGKCMPRWQLLAEWA